MKKKLILLIFAVLLTSCNYDNANVQTLDNEINTSQPLQQEFTVKANEKIGNIFVEGKKIQKSGMEIVDNYFPGAMTKGEDGSCYYFRTVKEGERETLTFYKNNNQKVCETEMPSKIRKKAGINSFVQYQGYFFVEIYGELHGEAKHYLSAINIKDGTWEEIIEGPGPVYKIFIYDNKFICAYGEDIKVYELTGDKKEFKVEKDLVKENAWVSVQCIVDEKIYYFYGVEEDEKMSDEKNDEYKGKVKCYDLNGENNKTICHYQSSNEASWYDNLRFDDQYIYLLVEYTLFRIPLYGGEIEKVSNKDIYFYDISDTYIFFLDELTKLYKIKKDLSGQMILVKESGPCDADTPFICVGNHIMLKECNEKQEDLIGEVAESELPIYIEYVNDYSWLTEGGVLEDTVKGIHLSDKKYKKIRDKLKSLN